MRSALAMMMVAGGLASAAAQAADAPRDARYETARERMVEQDLRGRGIRDPRVLDAMRRVPRERFVPEARRDQAHDDQPLPIGHGQTISQPYIVAYMTEALALRGDEKVLEIGTGSGYQAAVLAELAHSVYSIEIVEPLAAQAQQVLGELGYRNLHLRVGDGYAGWPEAAPFDAIMVTAAPDHVPQPLLEQLKVGGRMIIPVGEARARSQQLRLIERGEQGYSQRYVLPVRFVPLTREPDRR
jgi:protein-L-isoaspartate(D-aspartate) O-methyltransferase